MRKMSGDKEMLSTEQRSAGWNILWDDRTREMARKRIAWIPEYQRRIFILRAVLWEILEWDKREGSAEEWKAIVSHVKQELDKKELI